jgi:putative membrane protein
MGAQKFLKQVGIFVMSVAFVGCGGQAMESSKNSSDKLTDANIAAIVVEANNIDISAGKIALDRSSDSQIREFA